jgi:hypothetical protein
MSRFPMLIPLVLLGCCGFTAADTVYKSVDKDGNVTYSEKPPATKGEKARTREVPIDPNQNVIPSEKPSHIESLEAEQKSRSAQEHSNAANEELSRREKIANAESAVQQAEAALTAGQQTQPGDFIGRADGGVRPTQQRMERINSLQQAVDEAKANLERAQYDRDSY